MKIYLVAGLTGDEHVSPLIVAKVPHVLISYFSVDSAPCQMRAAALLQSAKETLVDSGAYTFLTNVTGGKKNMRGGIDVDQYLDKYVAWLVRWKRLNLIKWWVELDIDLIMGWDWVHAQRQKMVAAGLGKGLVNVWHSSADWDYWVYLLREARRPGRSCYVAIEGVNPAVPQLDYGKFLREAYARGVRVHGFKMTTAADLQKYPFYSVDSTSWIMPGQMGSQPALLRTGGVSNKNTTSMMRGFRTGKLRMGQHRLWHAPVPKAQTKYFRRELLQVSVRAWLTAERHLTDLWRLRGVDWEAAIKNPEIKDDEQREAS